MGVPRRAEGARAALRRAGRAGWALACGLALLNGCSKPPAESSGAEATSSTAATNTTATATAPDREGRFAELMNSGKNYYDQGKAEQAVKVFQEALALYPTRLDARLNLANALLLAGDAEAALAQARKVLEYDRNSAAAYFIAGCAHLRLRQPKEAVKMFLTARDLDRQVAAVNFLLGRAYQELGQTTEAINAYREAVKLDPQHPVAHYALGQLLLRAGQQEEGAKEMKLHAALPNKPGATVGPETYERCVHTEVRAPTPILKPDPAGIAVTFREITAEALGNAAASAGAPCAVLDYNRDGRNSLFVTVGTTNGFQLLSNQQGRFTPLGKRWKPRTNAPFARILVGDFNNDRFEDVLVVGTAGSQIFRFATNGAARDFTVASGLRNAKLKARDAGLVDLDFTGKLDILAVLPDGSGLRVLRNLGNMYFKDVTATSGVPANLKGLTQLFIDDWNNDDLLDVFVAREGDRPLYLQKVRGGPLVATNLPSGRLEGTVLTLGDVNNDGRTDLFVGGPDHVDLLLGGIDQFHRLPVAVPGLRRLALVDYDNDGWLDLLAAGQGLQVWRNLGEGSFTNRTEALGFAHLGQTAIADLAAADFDRDGDTDLVLAAAGGGLRLFRNEGGNANHQLKLRLLGNRSNASGLGIRIEVASGAFKVHRTITSLPAEIGVGKHDQLDAVVARWFDIPSSVVDVKPDPAEPLNLFEPVIPGGSCPYAYAWDGKRFRFISDMLGSSPLGLPLAEGIFIEADPFEYLALGGPDEFAPRDGAYVVQITEELREVLYLDESKLVVVDHPAGTEVHTTDKLRPRGPFPRGELWTLQNRVPLRSATRLDGSDVTDRLQAVDQKMLSPRRLREPQLRGLAEPYGVVLDFGPLETNRPLVLVLTGWLRFGGGMANISSAIDPRLPFPFPKLEVEAPASHWREVSVTVGAPSGRTKTILVDLAGKLPPGSQRLRLSTAFEIHWDRIALFERRLDGDTRITRLAPDRTDLHWRGFSEFADLPWDQPLTPVYERVFQTPPWRITPVGWCTRYGPVDELIAATDNALALLNGGDELTLEFAADRLPPRPPGTERSFFLYNVGWDKDSDFHVALGWQVDPLPWHGMDDQRYGRQPRPKLAADAVMARYNTRWVEWHTLKRPERRLARKN